MNWFKKDKNKENPNKQTEKMLQNIATLTRMAKSGLLFIDVVQHKVVISATVASMFLMNRERWQNFLHNVHLWFIYKVSQMNWNKYFLDAEVKAVREARKKFPSLTKLQEVDIRAKARAEIDIESLTPPKIDAYEFIISSDIKDGSEPEVFAVGRYENGSFDMVTFEELELNKQ